MPSRLKSIGPLVGKIKPIVATMREVRDTRYSADGEVRGWYKSKRWRDLRIAVFLRDNYTSKRSGLICSGRGNDPNAPIANHIIPHRGDPGLFWDINNIETVTKAEHDGEVQREERRGHLR